MLMVARRLRGSFTPSPVWTARSLSPFQSTDSTDWFTPWPTRESATAFARRSDRRRLYFVEPEVSFPVDVLEATTFFQEADSGGTP